MANPSPRGEPTSRAFARRFGEILDKVIFVGLLGVTIFSPIPYGTVDPWWEAAFECSVFALTSIWVIEVLCKRQWNIRQPSVLLPLVAVTAYAFIQCVQWPPSWFAKSSTQYMLSIDHYQTYLTARKCLALTLFLGLLLNHIPTVSRFKWLVRTVIVVGLGSALFGLLRQFMQPPDGTGGFVLPFLFYGLGYGQFLSPNPFAYLMEMPLGLAAGLALGGGADRKRWLIYFAIIIILWTALVLSNSRGGLMALACEVVFVASVAFGWYSERVLVRGGETARWAILVRRSLLIRVLTIGLVLVILSVGVLWIGGDQLAIKFSEQASVASANKTDGNTRHDIWKASWKLFKQNPWTGVGFGAYFLGITEFHESSGRSKLEQAHNEYLDLAANGGLVGLLLAAWFIAEVVRRAIKRLRTQQGYQRAATFGAVAGALGVAVHSFVDFGLQLTAVAVMLAALVVIIVADVPPDGLGVPMSPRRLNTQGPLGPSCGRKLM
jgi:O-antigen ligase